MIPRDQHLTSDHVIVVLGHREPGISREHIISLESHARLARAERIARRRPTRALVLTGYTSTGGLSEAEQMDAARTLPHVASVREVAGRTTAENASRCLPLILSLGGIRHVTVVTSFWHLRARYYFRPYRRYGLRVHHRWAVRRGGWWRLLGIELRGMRTMRRERREAFAQADRLMGTTTRRQRRGVAA
jgi:hypothetical protein